MKIEVEYLQFMWPMRHFLITCGEMGGKSNIIAVSFCMPVSKEPPLIACAIGKEAYSCKLIESTKEFIVKNLFISEVVEAYADEAIVKGERKAEYAKGDFPRKVYTTRFKI